jgi:hypothetical protein
MRATVAAFFLGQDGIVFQGYVRVEAARQHAFVLPDEVGIYSYIGELQAGQGGEVEPKR